VAHPKHAQVRERFDYRCGYCDVSEVDAGGELTATCSKLISGPALRIKHAIIGCSTHSGTGFLSISAKTNGPVRWNR